MKKLITVFFLLIQFGWALPAFVGGAITQCGSATTCTATYSPTAGNIVVACLIPAGNITPTNIKDNHSNSLTAGSFIAGTNVGSYIYYYTAVSSTTAFTANWTSSRASTIAVAEYSGGTGVIGSPTNGTATGNSTNPSFAPTANEANDIVVGCMGVATNRSQTANIGNLREEISASAPGGAIADNTATGATATTITTTSISGNWSAAGVVVTASVGTPAVTFVGPVTNVGPNTQQ